LWQASVWSKSPNCCQQLPELHFRRTKSRRQAGVSAGRSGRRPGRWGLLRETEGREDDFNIFNQKDVADTIGSVTKIITLLLGAIAGLSLVVGGIGIMNIMLVSVTERTREIGTRMAVGAQQAAIQLQFLIEAITLSLLGGLIGVLVGIGASKLVGVLTTFHAIVSVDSILLAFGVSFVIGVFFGYYPARRAAQLNPIDALRYE